MTNRKIQLIFDNAKSQIYDVNIGTPQSLPISAILFSIYVKHRHDIIDKSSINVKSLSFIDDVSIYIEIKSIKQNCIELQKTIQQLFNWAEKNNVNFDDSTSELIHFEKIRKIFSNTVILSNGTIIKPQEIIKYLEIYLKKKLNFQIHVNHKIAAAKRNLHAILALIKLKRDLSFLTARQLYLSCICTISDYGSEI